MMRSRIFFAVVFLLFLQEVAAVSVPVIGILSQETYSVQQYFPNEDYDSFIAASYVKFVESAGAKVVPIWYVSIFAYYTLVFMFLNYKGMYVYFLHDVHIFVLG